MNSSMPRMLSSSAASSSTSILSLTNNNHNNYNGGDMVASVATSTIPHQPHPYPSVTPHNNNNNNNKVKRNIFRKWFGGRPNNKSRSSQPPPSSHDDDDDIFPTDASSIRSNSVLTHSTTHTSSRGNKTHQSSIDSISHDANMVLGHFRKQREARERKKWNQRHVPTSSASPHHEPKDVLGSLLVFPDLAAAAATTKSKSSKSTSTDLLSSPTSSPSFNRPSSALSLRSTPCSLSGRYYGGDYEYGGGGDGDEDEDDDLDDYAAARPPYLTAVAGAAVAPPPIEPWVQRSAAQLPGGGGRRRGGRGRRTTTTYQPPPPPPPMFLTELQQRSWSGATSIGGGVMAAGRPVWVVEDQHNHNMYRPAPVYLPELRQKMVMVATDVVASHHQCIRADSIAVGVLVDEESRPLTSTSNYLAAPPSIIRTECSAFDAIYNGGHSRTMAHTIFPLLRGSSGDGSPYRETNRMHPVMVHPDRASTTTTATCVVCGQSWKSSIRDAPFLMLCPQCRTVSPF